MADELVESGPPHGEVRGSTLGIIGYGRVGREVARRAAAFGARILAANRTPREADPGVERVYPLAELDRMLPECDAVAICTALGPETTGLIDAHRLALMKPTAFLINIARGQVMRRTRFMPHCATAGSAALRSTCGGNTRPLPSRSDAAPATRSTNCRTSS